MTIEQKRMIAEMRFNGLGYVRIARNLKLSENTVKSYCRRHNLTSGSKEMPIFEEGVTTKPCKFCGKTVVQNPTRKEKLFCSDKCRNLWWNRHLFLVKRKAYHEIKCKTCGKTFLSYGNAHRKYCSHACYIRDRFETI